MDGKAGLRAGEQDDAAHVPEHERRARVHGVEDVLDGERVGAEARDQVGDAGVDVPELFRQRQTLPRGDGALLDQTVPTRRRSRRAP